MIQTNIVNDCEWVYRIVWFIRSLASQISTIIILAFSQRNKISRLLWWIQQQDRNGLIWLGCWSFSTFITFPLYLLASDWSGCQVLASDWSILEVGKYLRYLWLFTSSVCYKTIEQSSSKINKPRLFFTRFRHKNTKYVPENFTKLFQHCSVHILDISLHVCMFLSIFTS